MQFEHHHDPKTGVQLGVPPDLPAVEVIVRARRWPFSGVRVYVNGWRWGWRGPGF